MNGMSVVRSGLRRFSFASLSVIALLLTPRELRAQAFSDSGISLVGGWSASSSWADYDNDGDKDLLVAGDRPSSAFTTTLYRNDGGGVFTTATAGLQTVGSLPSMAWGDYDNDGFPDLVLGGDTGSGFSTKLYHNNGNGTFSDSGVALPGYRAASADWGDYNNDGYADLVLTGESPTTMKFTKLYRNNRNGTFTEIPASLPGACDGMAKWGDTDKDGDLDLMLCGNNFDVISGPFMRIYINNGNDTFTYLSTAGLPSVLYASNSFGDYDNDGDLDILVAGFLSPTTSISRIYRNNSNGTFTNIGAGLAGMSDSGSGWGDFDNDGDLDVVIAGEFGQAIIYRNNGGTFSNIGQSLTGVSQATASWADYDNDGKLDLFLGGNTPSGPVAKLYHNIGATANTIPAAPSGLSATVFPASVNLSWSAASDAQTPASGLLYNVRVGTTPGGNQVMAPLSNVASGFRRVTALGNANGRTTLRLKDLSVGTYYWSVQSIDTALAGSPFAPEGTFTILTVPVGLSRFSLD